MKLAILSRNKELYSTRRLIEEIEAKGHEGVIIDHLGCNIVAEMDRPHMYYRGQVLSGIDAVIPRIGSSVTFFGTAVVRQFELMNIPVANSSVSIVRSRDKLRSTQIFSNHGIPIPKTIFANHTRKVDPLIDEVGGTPLVIKLLEGTQGIGVVLAETRKAAKSVIEAFYGLKADILIQEFIQEAQGSDIRAFVVNGKVVGAMKRQGKEGDFRSNLHRGGTAEPIRLKKEERETALRAVKAMGLSIAGVDMLPSSRGPLVLEVNSSPGIEGIEKATGKDIAGMVVDYMIGRVDAKPKRDRVGV